MPARHGHAPPVSPPPPGATGADGPEQRLGCCKHPSFICLPSGRLVSLSLCVFSSRSNLYNRKKCPTTFLSLGKHPPYIIGSNNTIRGSRGRCWRSVPAARGLSGRSHARPHISRGSGMWPPCLGRGPSCLPLERLPGPGPAAPGCRPEQVGGSTPRTRFYGTCARPCML